MKNYGESKKLCERNEYILECWHPLEIRSEDGASFASGFAAEVLLEYFECLEENEI